MGSKKVPSQLAKAVSSSKRAGSARPLSGSVKVTSSDPEELKGREEKKPKNKRGESPKVQANSLASKFSQNAMQNQGKNFEPMGIGQSSLYQ